MTDRYDDELKLVLEDLADLMQNEASPKKSKMLQLLMNNKSERNQMCTLPNQFLMKHIEILVKEMSRKKANFNLTILLSFDKLKVLMNSCHYENFQIWF